MSSIQHTYHINDSIASITHYHNDQIHRVDGPAVTRFNEDGSVWHHIWYINGQKHRINSPAFISYFNDGLISSSRYYLNDIDCTQQLIDAHYFDDETDESTKELIWNML